MGDFCRAATGRSPGRGRGIPGICAALLSALVLTPVAADAATRVGPPGRASAPAEVVILLSLDGMRWDDLQRVEAPAFERMRREGASAGRLIPPFPASTFPAHATLSTGVFPDRHGIVGNRFLDRERGAFRKEADAAWLMAEPLWITAERQGVKAAVYHWVLSNTPWRGSTASLREPYSGGVADARAIDAVLAWLARPVDERPRLILAYLHGVDRAGHRHGPASEAVDRAVVAADRQIERLLERLSGAPMRAALVVVSDHGMAPALRARRLDRILSGETRRVRVFSTGGSANLYCPDAAVCDEAERRLIAAGGLRVYRKEDLPRSLRYQQGSRTGDLVVIAPRGEYLLERRPGRSGESAGVHGYGPDVADMHGILFAWGAGIRRGARVDRLDAVDVAPLILRLLGIDGPVGIDGEAPTGLLAGSAGEITCESLSGNE